MADCLRSGPHLWRVDVAGNCTNNCEDQTVAKLNKGKVTNELGRPDCEGFTMSYTDYANLFGNNLSQRPTSETSASAPPKNLINMKCCGCSAV